MTNYERVTPTNKIVVKKTEWWQFVNERRRNLKTPLEIVWEKNEKGAEGISVIFKDTEDGSAIKAGRI